MWAGESKKVYRCDAIRIEEVAQFGDTSPNLGESVERTLKRDTQAGKAQLIAARATLFSPNHDAISFFGVVPVAHLYAPNEGDSQRGKVNSNGAEGAMTEAVGGGVVKTVPKHWKVVLDGDAISRSISRISYEILERNRDLSKLAVVGIRSAGEFLALRIHERLQEIEKRDISFGVIDITLYRDDLSNSRAQPTLKGTDLPFSISGSRIILVDDVFYTGRTVRAALDAIIDFGRPACVELAVLADRGHRELPIRPDYVGKNLPTAKSEFVKVRLSEQGFADGVYLVGSSDGQKKGEEE